MATRSFALFVLVGCTGSQAPETFSPNWELAFSPGRMSIDCGM